MWPALCITDLPAAVNQKSMPIGMLFSNTVKFLVYYLIRSIISLNMAIEFASIESPSTFA